jgi:ABC-2 type transport system ATP-binding protein
VLLLDEPTFGVDPISRRDLWLILHEMVASGVTVVVSTAYMDEAERCDRVALLDKGRVVALDTPEALQRSLPVTVMAVRTGDPRRAAAVLAGAPCVERAALFGDVVHVSLANVARDCPEARAVLEAAGMAVLGVEEIVPSMEDVFIEKTGSKSLSRQVARDNA